MVELRTYDGDMQQLADFCHSAWTRRYQGKMPFALWSPEFFEWELADGPASRDYLVGAYEGTRLVGFLAARPQRFHLRGEELDGTWGSYFTVDPDVENQAVALKLNLEQRRRHRERGARVNMGFVITNYSAARGKDFWLKQPKLIKPVRNLGLWVRTLDYDAVARFSMHRSEVLGTHLARYVLGGPSAPRRPDAIRPFAPTDAAACAELLNRASRQADFGYVWDERLAGRQLAFKDATHTFVAVADGRVVGLVNYCPMRMMGRATVDTGVIDFLVTEGLTSRTAIDLVRTALADMVRRGLHIAMALRISGMPWWPLAWCGFTAMPRSYCYVAQPVNFEQPDWRLKKLHVHWR